MNHLSTPPPLSQPNPRTLTRRRRRTTSLGRSSSRLTLQPPPQILIPFLATRRSNYRPPRPLFLPDNPSRHPPPRTHARQHLHPPRQPHKPPDNRRQHHARKLRQRQLRRDQIRRRLIREKQSQGLPRRLCRCVVIRGRGAGRRDPVAECMRNGQVVLRQ